MTPADKTGNSNVLLRILGLGFGIAVSLGTSIGVGILRAPGIVAAHVPNAAGILAAWIGGGLFAFLGTLCVIELGTSIPKAGGWYIYARTAFGDFVGFAVGWGFWLSFASSLGYAGVALGEYLGALVPALAGRTRETAVAVLLLFFLFQFLGLRPVSRFQEWIGFMKGLVFFGLAAACIVFSRGHPGGAALPRPALPLAAAGWSGVILAVQAVIKTYDGWQAPCFFTEEDRNPIRNLPRAMIIGTLAVTAIYVGINLALLRVLSVPEIASSTLPVADAVGRVFGGPAPTIITGVAVLNVAGLLNTIFLAAPLILFAMARDGWFFSSASRVNPRGVPVAATIWSGAIGLVVLFGGSFERIFGFSAFLTVITYTAGYAAVIALRRRHPDLPRPFRTWGYPIVPLIALAVSAAFLVGAVAEDTENAVAALLFFGLCLPAYLLLKRARKRLEAGGKL